MKATVKPVEIGTYFSYREALEDMERQGVTHLGWVNGGIRIPKGEFVRVYKDWSGANTLCVNVERRLAYSVDMGD